MLGDVRAPHAQLQAVVALLCKHGAQEPVAHEGRIQVAGRHGVPDQVMPARKFAQSTFTCRSVSPATPPSGTIAPRHANAERKRPTMRNSGISGISWCMIMAFFGFLLSHTTKKRLPLFRRAADESLRSSAARTSGGSLFNRGLTQRLISGYVSSTHLTFSLLHDLYTADQRRFSGNCFECDIDRCAGSDVFHALGECSVSGAGFSNDIKP